MSWNFNLETEPIESIGAGPNDPSNTGSTLLPPLDLSDPNSVNDSKSNDSNFDWNNFTTQAGSFLSSLPNWVGMFDSGMRDDQIALANARASQSMYEAQRAEASAPKKNNSALIIGVIAVAVVAVLVVLLVKKK